MKTTVEKILLVLVVVFGVALASAEPIRSMVGGKFNGLAKEDEVWVNPYVVDGMVGLWDIDFQGTSDGYLFNLVEGGEDVSLQFSGEANGWMVNEGWRNLDISALQIPNNNCTLEIVLRKNDSSSVSRYYPCGLIASTMEFCGTAWINSGGLARYAVYFRDSQTTSSYYIDWADLMTPHTETFVADQSFKAKAYLNGELVVTKNLGAATQGNIRAFRANGDTSKGFVKCIRIYNRALTADEIQYNYEIDSARFGL